ncbi:hypothetical protein ACFQX7_21610 [Luedemannella flava]
MELLLMLVLFVLLPLAVAVGATADSRDHLSAGAPHGGRRIP